MFGGSTIGGPRRVQATVISSSPRVSAVSIPSPRRPRNGSALRRDPALSSPISARTRPSGSTESPTTAPGRSLPRGPKLTSRICLHPFEWHDYEGGRSRAGRRPGDQLGDGLSTAEPFQEFGGVKGGGAQDVAV